MPADLQTPEIAARVGALETEALGAGGLPAHAWILREAARNVNRAISKRDTLWGYAWDGRYEGQHGESWIDRASMSMSTRVEWYPWWPVPVPAEKMPGHNRMDVHVDLDTEYHLQGGEILLRAYDEAQGASVPADDDPFVLVASDDTESRYSAVGIPLREGPRVDLNFWMRGRPGTGVHVRAIDGWGESSIFLDYSGAPPRMDYLAGYAVVVHSVWPITNPRTWGPYFVTSAAYSVHPGDPEETSVEYELDVEEIDPAAQAYGVLATVHRMPRFKPRSIIVETYREFV